MNQAQPLPVTIRFPPVGRKEFYTGLTRNALYRMYKEGLLQTTLVNPGNKKGRGYRVIFLLPLLDYLYEKRQFAPADSPELPENPAVPTKTRKRKFPKRK